MKKSHQERHQIENIGWLRAAVLGANDGIISTASLVLGVASAHVSHRNILLTATAALVAGSMSMATGEYVSVSSQADTEKAAIDEERQELENDFESEHRELAAIYMKRGLAKPLAKQVAEELMRHDALAAHTRDELGISDLSAARPLQAATTSAASFASGALLPLIVTAFTPEKTLPVFMAVTALVGLAFLGGIAAKSGGAKIWPGAMRVTFWSALAMGVSSAVGLFFNGVG